MSKVFSIISNLAPILWSKFPVFVVIVEIAYPSSFCSQNCRLCKTCGDCCNRRISCWGRIFVRRCFNTNAPLIFPLNKKSIATIAIEVLFDRCKHFCEQNFSNFLICLYEMNLHFPCGFPRDLQCHFHVKKSALLCCYERSDCLLV